MGAEQGLRFDLKVGTYRGGGMELHAPWSTELYMDDPALPKFRHNPCFKETPVFLPNRKDLDAEVAEALDEASKAEKGSGAPMALAETPEPPPPAVSNEQPEPTGDDAEVAEALKNAKGGKGKNGK